MEELATPSEFGTQRILCVNMVSLELISLDLSTSRVIGVLNLKWTIIIRNCMIHTRNIFCEGGDIATKTTMGCGILSVFYVSMQH